MKSWPMLLNELQKQQRELRSLRQQLSQMTRDITKRRSTKPVASKL